MSYEANMEMHGDMPPPEIVRDIFLDEGEKAMRRGLLHVHGEVVARTPFRSGTARRGWHTDVDRGRTRVTGVIGNGVFYVPWLEGGTGLYGPRHHWIEPKFAKALRWPAGGAPSLFVGGRRVSGAAGPGFTLAGRVRSGAAGAQAGWMFARRVRGIRPRRMLRDSVYITRGRVNLEFRMGAIRAARRVEAWRAK